MPILNYTTKIQPEKTVSEIQARLVKNGARQMSFQYNDDGTLEALTFQIVIDSIPVYFSLTPDFEGVLTAMEKDKVAKNLLTKEQACRVAWRIEKDWIEAQLAKYVLKGSQANQKKFIGNAVVPHVVKAWAEAYWRETFSVVQPQALQLF